MPLEGRIHRGHHGLHDTLLDVDGFEHAWEAGVEDGVEAVGVVEEDEGGVDAFRLEVAEEGGSDGSHALYVATCRASEGKGVKNVKERSLAKDFSERIIRRRMCILDSPCAVSCPEHDMSTDRPRHI